MWRDSLLQLVVRAKERLRLAWRSLVEHFGHNRTAISAWIAQATVRVRKGLRSVRRSFSARLGRTTTAVLEWDIRATYAVNALVRKYIRKFFPEVPLAVSVIASLVGVIIFSLGWKDWKGTATAIVGLCGTLVSLYFYRLKKREQTAIVALTTKSLLTQDRGNLDEMLGALISGTYEWTKIDPAEELFKALENICSAQDYEMKRRVSEALPALFRLDMERAKSLVRILRTDWHHEEWKGDIRRRAVESLTCIIELDMGFAVESIRYVAGDEIYTTIAAIEVLYECRRRCRKLAEVSFRAMTEEIRGAFPADQADAIDHLWRFLGMAEHDSKGAFRECGTMVDHDNPYIQICAARNLRRPCVCYPRCRRDGTCSGKPEKVLSLVERILEKKDNRNARRPIAKGGSLDCLIALLHSPYSHRAKQIILRLIADPDMIIRVTAFDKIERLWKQDREFAEVVIQAVLARPDDLQLVARATRAQRRLCGAG